MTASRLKPVVSRVLKGYYVAELQDVRGEGSTADEARQDWETNVLKALTWQPPHVEVSPTRIRVAYLNRGEVCYDAYDLDGQRTCSTSTSQSFREVVEDLKRYAVEDSNTLESLT